MITKLALYYHTLKHLKFVQIRYRLFYSLRKIVYRVIGHRYSISQEVPTVIPIIYTDGINSNTSWYPKDKFVFLNISKNFNDYIDWNFADHGKLWLYNLNYFEYLHQDDVSTSEGLRLIMDFIDKSKDLKDGLEPFPISLRLINWIKFLASRKINETKINQSLLAQLNILQKNLEYHLLGNHLLENGFALLFAGIYFKNEKVFQNAESILEPQLKEQILEDGGHFELSPMYHQIMLFRILDCINIINSNNVDCKALLKLLQNSASKMISWLKQMTYSNGDVPLFNDSAKDIAPTSSQLFKYAEQLRVKDVHLPLGDSGFRKVCISNTELVIDVGEVGPSYQPGHAHSDTFSFELRINHQPYIVDTGISTYEKSERRNIERSTISHNTVKIGHHDQSEVWGGFRVARRAVPTVLSSSENHITAEHDGYNKIGYTHERTFKWQDKRLDIIDRVKGGSQESKAFLHFHPFVKVKIGSDRVITTDAEISVKGAQNIDVEEYCYADRFNSREPSERAVITFTEELKISISW